MQNWSQKSIKNQMKIAMKSIKSFFFLKIDSTKIYLKTWFH